MSTRHLRRLQEQLNAGVAQQALVEEDSDEEEHEDEEQQGKAAKPFNPFDLLSDDEVRAACHLPHWVVLSCTLVVAMQPPHIVLCSACQCCLERHGTCALLTSSLTCLEAALAIDDLTDS